MFQPIVPRMRESSLSPKVEPLELVRTAILG